MLTQPSYSEQIDYMNSLLNPNNSETDVVIVAFPLRENPINVSLRLKEIIVNKKYVNKENVIVIVSPSSDLSLFLKNQNEEEGKKILEENRLFTKEDTSKYLDKQILKVRSLIERKKTMGDEDVTSETIDMERCVLIFEDTFEALSLFGKKMFKFIVDYGGIKAIYFMVRFGIQEEDTVENAYNIISQFAKNIRKEYPSDVHTTEEQTETAITLRKIPSVEKPFGQSKELVRILSGEKIEKARDEAIQNLIIPRIKHNIILSHLTVPQFFRSIIFSFKRYRTRWVEEQEKYLKVQPNNFDILDAPYVTSVKFPSEIDRTKSHLILPSSLGGLDVLQVDDKSLHNFDLMEEIKKAVLPSLHRSINDSSHKTETASILGAYGHDDLYHFHTVASPKLIRIVNLLLMQKKSRMHAERFSKTRLSKIINTIFQQNENTEDNKRRRKRCNKKSLSKNQIENEDEKIVLDVKRLHDFKPYDRHVIYVQNKTVFNILDSMLCKTGIKHLVISKGETGIEKENELVEKIFNSEENTSKNIFLHKLHRATRRSISSIKKNREEAKKALKKKLIMEGEISDDGDDCGNDEESDDNDSLSSISSEDELNYKIFEEEEKATKYKFFVKNPFEKAKKLKSSLEDGEERSKCTLLHPTKKEQKVPWVILTDVPLTFRPTYVSHLHLFDNEPNDATSIYKMVDMLYKRESCSHYPLLTVHHHVSSISTTKTTFSGFENISSLEGAENALNKLQKNSDDEERNNDASVSECCPSDIEEGCTGNIYPSEKYYGIVTRNGKKQKSTLYDVVCRRNLNKYQTNSTFSEFQDIPSLEVSNVIDAYGIINTTQDEESLDENFPFMTVHDYDQHRAFEIVKGFKDRNDRWKTEISDFVFKTFDEIATI